MMNLKANTLPVIFGAMFCAAVLTACVPPKKQKDLDSRLLQYEQMVRWSQWDGAATFLSQDYLEENPVTNLDMERLRLFVNFLGAYAGNKNVIMISDAWQRLGSQTAFTSGIDDGYYVTSENLADLKQIQTAALYNKVTLNVVNTRRPGVDVTPLADTSGAASISQQAELAALTGGFHYRPNNKGLASMVDRVIEQNEHYYRIRYYSSSQSDAFRSVKVRAKGLGRVTYSMGGYYAGAQTVRNDEAALVTAQPAAREISVDMKTDWLTWYPVTLRKYRAYLAVSQRAYDAEGRLVGEQVTTAQLTKKGRYTKAPFEGTLSFDIPGKDVARLEAVIIDMMSGERVVLNGKGEPVS